MSRPIVHRFPDASSVAKNAAADLTTRLGELLARLPEVHIQITGGTVGILTLTELATIEAFSQLDLRRLHVWWGDERFLSSDHEDRNAVQAKKALFNKLNGPLPRLHEFPSTDEGLMLDAAAEKFSSEVRALAPTFSIALVGMGPDGHVCSLFPGKTYPSDNLLIVAEHDSPKPPAERLSFSYQAMNQVEEIWFVVAGADKQQAVDVAFGDNPTSLPVGKIKGSKATHWYLDSTAGTTVFGC